MPVKMMLLAITIFLFLILILKLLTALVASAAELVVLAAVLAAELVLNLKGILLVETRLNLTQ